MRFFRPISIAGLLPALIFLLSIQASEAGSARWKASPVNGDWNTAANWTPMTVPNSPTDTATFVQSHITNVFISAPIDVDGIVFNLGASAFTIAVSPTFTLNVDGLGMVNNSGITQNFVNNADASGRGQISFFNNATAGGSANVYIGNEIPPPGTSGGRTNFFGTSTAGNAIFIDNGSTMSGGAGGRTLFTDSSTSGTATFTNNGGISLFGGGGTSFLLTSGAGNAVFTNNGGAGAGASFVQFFDTSTADTAIFINNGGTVGGGIGGQTVFNGTSTAANAVLIANAGSGGGAGATIYFTEDSTGDTARVELFGNGNLDISFHNAPGITTGSIEGDGNAFLGATNLTVGSSDLSTTFSGVMQDGGFNGGAPGSFTKIGTGTLTLSGANTYTGGTTVSDGTLLITSRTGSGTGTGAVQVNVGTLGGTGKIFGPVTLGTGSSSGAFLSPGTMRTGTLTIQRRLVFNSDSTYNFELRTSNATADKVTAKGVTISGALFSFIGIGNGTLAQGTVFTAINNTAATPIAGTFANLADGSTFTVGTNTFRASYEGGTGNDLTLTVQ